MNSVLTIQRNTPSLQMTVYRKMKVDPTHTLSLRNAFTSAMRKRFRALRGLIRLAVVEQDVLALSGKNNLMVQAAGLPGNRAFDFSTSQAKVQGFMAWLRGQMDKGILEVGTLRQAGSSIDQAWTDLYIRDSYQRGIQRSRYELRKAGFPTPSLDETGGLSASMSTPFHMDRVGVLYSRAFEELKGITAAMDSQISRVLSQGLVDGDNPRLLARKLNGVIKGGGLGITDSIGRFIPAERRAEMLARTEIIRAHHQGMIQEYKNWGLEGVRVQAEWSTAMDDRVCSICEGMEGNVYTLEEATNMIPAHPSCRCIALPTKPDGISQEVPGDFINSEELFESGGVLDFDSLPENVQKKISRTEWDSTNGVLRFGAQRTDHSKRIDKLFKDNGISMPANTEVYRGVQGNIFPTEIGSTFRDPGYLRYTGSKNRAKIFMDYKNRDVQFIKIKLPKGVKTIPGQHTFEKEALLPRNSKFRINSVKRKSNGGYYNDEMEAIRAFLYEIEVQYIF